MSREDLINLRVSINRDRAILNTIQRQINRIDGKEVIHSSREEDADYLESRAGIPREASKEYLIAFHKQLLMSVNQERAQAARLRDELPLTPCAVIAAIVRARKRKARQRKR